MTAAVSPPRGLTDAAPFPPDCAARFRPVRRLGEGGFGVVYEAIDRTLDRPVAIKLLTKEVLAEAEQIGRFLDEARVTAALSHPHVVRVLDSGAEHGVPWIAYELLPGRSLRDALTAQPAGLAPELVVRIAEQVGGALDVAHARGILHRDIKPDNVLEAEDGSHKVTDFGIAKWSGREGVRTRTGVILGTPVYLSPEQAAGEPPSAATDRYALAIMLYELLAGRPPFSHAQPLIVLEAHRSATPPALSVFRAGLPAALDAVLRQALAKRPAERFATCAELAAALAESLRPGAQGPTLAVASGRPKRPVTSFAPAPVPPAPRRFRAAGALFAAVAFALATFALRPTPAPPRPPSPATASPSQAPAPPPVPTALLARLGVLYEEMDALHQASQQFPSTSAERLMAHVKIGGMRGRILHQTLSCLKGAISLLENEHRHRLPRTAWLELDEILDITFASAGRAVLGREPELVSVVAHLREAVRAASDVPHAQLLGQTLESYTVNLDAATKRDFRGVAPALRRAADALAERDGADPAILEARIRLLSTYATFLSRGMRSVADSFSGDLKEREVAGAQLEPRRQAAELCRRLLASGAVRRPHDARGYRRVRRVLYAANDLLGIAGADTGLVQEAVDLARSLCAAAGSLKTPGDEHDHAIAHLEDAAASAKQPPLCAGDR